MMKKVKLRHLTPDSLNANRGTVRGAGMVERSLSQYGAGRSILVDKEGRIIAGNKTHAAATEIGLDDAVLVESDGTQLVVVKRAPTSTYIAHKAERLQLQTTEPQRLVSSGTLMPWPRLPRTLTYHNSGLMVRSRFQRLISS